MQNPSRVEVGNAKPKPGLSELAVAQAREQERYMEKCIRRAFLVEMID
jgi:hypothetical protein